MSYSAITAHYVIEVGEKWESKQVLLGLYDWNPEERHTWDKIRPYVYEVSAFSASVNFDHLCTHVFIEAERIWNHGIDSKEVHFRH